MPTEAVRIEIVEKVNGAVTTWSARVYPAAGPSKEKEFGHACMASAWAIGQLLNL